MRRIFISYRRDDTEGQAGRLFQDLSKAFGSELVFMDVVGIEPGIDFRRAIEKQTASCGVMLALIGRNWLSATNADGKRRLDDVNDVVRFETASALRRDIPVIPVLVQGARMPRAEDLPDDLKNLAFRNGVEVSHARWDSDVQLLTKALHRYVRRADQVEPEPGATSPGSEARLSSGQPSTRPTSAQSTRNWGLPVVVILGFLILGAVWLAFESSKENNQPQQAATEKVAAGVKAAGAEGIAEKAVAEQRLNHPSETQAPAEQIATAALNAGIAVVAALEEESADKRVIEGRSWDEMLCRARNIAATQAGDCKQLVDPNLNGLCIFGFVWREATAGDKVCVLPKVRELVAAENRLAGANRQAGGGADGLMTCKKGLVWREAFPNDFVCVVPASRALAAADNAPAERRLARTLDEAKRDPKNTRA